MESDQVKLKQNQMEGMVKRLSTQCSQAMTLMKRTQMLEEGAKQTKETGEKRHDNLKELIKQGHAMLEHRLEVFEGLEEKCNILHSEMNKNRQIHEDHRKKMLEELSGLKMDQAGTKTELTRHMTEYTSTFTNNEFFMDKCN